MFSKVSECARGGHVCDVPMNLTASSYLCSQLIKGRYGNIKMMGYKVTIIAQTLRCSERAPVKTLKFRRNRLTGTLLGPVNSPVHKKIACLHIV